MPLCSFYLDYKWRILRNGDEGNKLREIGSQQPLSERQVGSGRCWEFNVCLSRASFAVTRSRTMSSDLS